MRTTSLGPYNDHLWGILSDRPPADPLAAADCITRGREPGHHSVSVELTATGQHLASQAAEREQELARILRQLSPAGRRQVTTTPRQLAEAVGEGRGKVSPTLVVM